MAAKPPPTTDRKGNDLLCNATVTGDDKEAASLIDESGHDVDCLGKAAGGAKDKVYTPLCWAVSVHDADMVEFLIENGADINKTNKVRLPAARRPPPAAAQHTGER